MTTQYRLVIKKSDERREGDDDATTVFSVPADLVAGDDFDATVEFMRGRLKVTGASADVFAELKSGAATAALNRLASRL